MLLKLQPIGGALAPGGKRFARLSSPLPLPGDRFALLSDPLPLVSKLQQLIEPEVAPSLVDWIRLVALMRAHALQRSRLPPVAIGSYRPYTPRVRLGCAPTNARAVSAMSRTRGCCSAL